ncbi:hypothetical protein ACFOY8_13120 [Thalassospira xianhensis]|uniref:Type 4 secretion system PilS N-terminal domain-containing protein n=1 Tax=Thalassospira xiamenensis TaxID=220697 RepID=A0A285TXF7_9PROT|nr:MULTISPECIES: hypothetical protein [Thalassospira]SOC27241.1 hypothetical protein SAMN05428964_105321 [Thalassospira xiamenensis]
MYSLIVAVISIALGVGIALSTIYYGGSAFTGSSAKTAEATLINSAQQISGATALFRTENSGNNAANIAELITENYLQAVPTAPNDATGAWEIGGVNDSFAYIQLSTAVPATPAAVSDNAICVRAEADNGPTTNDEATVADLASITLATGVPFDCLGVTGEGLYFAFKM